MISVLVTSDHILEAPHGSRFSPIDLAIADALLIPTGRVKIIDGCPCTAASVFIADPGRNSGASRTINEPGAAAHLAWLRGESISPMTFVLGEPMQAQKGVTSS